MLYRSPSGENKWRNSASTTQPKRRYPFSGDTCWSTFPSPKLCDELSLQPGEYFLYVSRLEPENNALLVVKAFERTSHRQKLVIVGDAPYSDNYIRRLKQTQDPRNPVSRRYLRDRLP